MSEAIYDQVDVTDYDIGVTVEKEKQYDMVSVL